MSFIDRTFKEYAVEVYGDIFTEEEIANARAQAFEAVADRTEATGQKQPKGTVKRFFLEYLESRRRNR